MCIILVLKMSTGQDPHDNYTSAIPFETIPDYAAECNNEGLRGAKIGIPRNAITVSSTNGPEITAFNASISVFKNLGATIVDNADFPDLAGYRNFSGGSVRSIHRCFILWLTFPRSVHHGPSCWR